MIPRIPGWPVAVAVGLAVATLLSRERPFAHALAADTYESVYYLPPPEALRYLSLSWDEAAADLIWMRALVYFGSEVRHRGEVAHVFNYADAILTLDPYFRRAYHWAGTAGMYRPVRVEVADIRRSIEYLERAVERFPDDGALAWDLGASIAYELVPRLDDPDEKAREEARALPFMETAARLGAGPYWTALSNAATLERLGQRERAIRHLQEMAASIDDADARAQILDRLRTLTHEADVEAFAEAMRDAERRRLRDFPYAPATLYLLLGARPPEAAYVDDARTRAPADP